MSNILLFDGECNLCNRSVLFVIKHDKRQKFVFASLQSDAGKTILKKYGLPTPQNVETFVLVKANTIYMRSGAALEIAKELGGLWKLLYAFILIPAFIRDMVYNFIAKRRHKFFRKSNCLVVTPELKSRFLE